MRDSSEARPRRHRASVFAMLIAVAFASPAGVSAHSGNEDPNAIHACQKPGQSFVRIVDAGEACKGGEIPVHWTISAPTTDPAPLQQRVAALEALVAAQGSTIATLQSELAAQAAQGARTVNAETVVIAEFGTEVSEDLGMVRGVRFQGVCRNTGDALGELRIVNESGGSIVVYVQRPLPPPATVNQGELPDSAGATLALFTSQHTWTVGHIRLGDAVVTFSATIAGARAPMPAPSCNFSLQTVTSG